MTCDLNRPISHESMVDEDELMALAGITDVDNYSCEFLPDGCSSFDDQLSELDELKHICNIFEKGVKVTRRKCYLRLGLGGCPITFTGSDAVSFLVDNGYANSREKALRMGRKMAYEFALFRHESNDFDLEDKHDVFYKFTSPDHRVVNCNIISPATHDCATLNAISDAFEDGVVVGSNVYKSKTYKNTFVGSNAVTFLVSSQIAKTRQDAVRIGQLIMEKLGLFHHITRKHKFKDKRLLYKFVRPNKRRFQENHINNHRSAIPIEETAQRFIEVVQPGNAFAGSNAVDAMVAAGLAASRSEAVLLGEKLVSDLQLFHCVQDRGRSFFDRGDVYYDYYKGSRTVSSQWLENKVSDDKQTYSGEFAEKVDSVMGIVDSDGKQSTITEQPAVKNEGCTDCCGTSIIDLEHLLGLSDSSRNIVEESLEESSLSGARYFDRFCVILENEGEECDASTVSYDCNETVKTTEEKLSIEEWKALLDRCAMEQSGQPPASQKTVKRMMRAGVPESLRRRAWTVITGVDLILQERSGDYQSLVKTATLFMEDESNALSEWGQSLKGVIERDLHRTFPRHSLFCNRSDNDGEDSCLVRASSDSIVANMTSEEATPDGLMRLRRVLYAYSVYDNEVGYCQGMNFLAAMFLTFLSEEESFWLFVAVMNEEPYSMRNLFAEDMAGVHESLYVTEKMVEKFLPKLHKHMEKEHIHMSMFATQWLMTLFTSTFPFDFVSRVWDSYIVEGWKVIYRIVLSLLEHAQHDLMDLDLEEILAYLRDEFPAKIDGPSVVKASLKIPLRHKHIRKYTNEWRAAQNGQKHDTRKPSTHSESGESSSSSGMSIKRPSRRSVGEGGKHVGRKLLPGLSICSSL